MSSITRILHWSFVLVGLLLTIQLGFSQHFNWAREMKGTIIEPVEMDVDLFGNMAVCGSFRDSINLQPNFDSTVIGASIYNGFIARYDQNGNPTWWHRIGMDCRSVAMGPFGSVYVAGDFEGTVDFDPSANTYELTSTGTGWKRYICKLDSAQGLEWVFQLSFGVHALETDAVGNLYVAGAFNGTRNFNPLGTSLTATSGPNGTIAYVAKYSPNGICQWVRHCFTTSNAQSQGNIMVVNDLHVASSGRIFLGGSYRGEFRDPTTQETYVSKDETYDIFYSALNDSGDFLFTNVHGSKSTDQLDGITELSDGGVVITGFGQGNVKFGPANTGTTMHNRASQECFVVKLDSVGEFQWLRATITQSNSNGVEVFVSDEDELWLLCGTNDSAAFISTNDTLFFNDNSGLSLFLVRYNSDGDIIDADGLIDAGQFKNPKAARLLNGKLWLCGMYEGLVDLNFGTNNRWMEEQTFVHGFVVNYDVCNDDDYLMHALDTAICDGDSVAFLGKVYYEPGIYEDRVLLADGCDSLDRLILSVNPVIVNEKDSLVCDNEAFMYLGQNISESGSYPYYFQSSNGCDSNLILHAMFNDIQVSFHAGTHYLSSGWTGGEYQWYACGSGELIEIVGADSQAYAPSENGAYVVVSKVGECVDTSACFQFDVLSTNSIRSSGVLLFPNPTTGMLQVRSSIALRAYDIHDLSGRKLMQEAYVDQTIQLDLPSGVYIISFYSETGEKHTQLLQKL